MKKYSLVFILAFLIFTTLIVYLLDRSSNKEQQLSQVNISISVTPPQVLGQRTKISGCKAVNSLPDPACTPGEIFTQITKEQVCTPGYAASVRNVPNNVKNQVYREYDILSHSPGEYEVDHLISLELGGSNDIANLWPEAADPRPGYHEKDQVENFLHNQVCNGSLSLQEAQSEIAQNWLSVYRQMNQQ